MKATLVDITVVSRTIDLPDECPNCGTLLKDPGSCRTINAWEYQDQKRVGGFQADSGQFEWDETWASMPEGGESYLSYVSYWCAACSTELASGEEVQVSLGEMGTGPQVSDLEKDWREEVRKGETLSGFFVWLGERLERERKLAQEAKPEAP